jgi:hypothetical protein
MVARELLEELKSLRWNFDWTYDGRNRRIRAKLKSQPDGQLFDPIGAICYLKAGVAFDEESWFRAAEEIGLSHIDAGDLTAAANNLCNDRAYTKNLRRQMIDGLSLKPEACWRGFRPFHWVYGYLSGYLNETP